MLSRRMTLTLQIVQIIKCNFPTKLMLLIHFGGFPVRLLILSSFYRILCNLGHLKRQIPRSSTKQAEQTEVAHSTHTRRTATDHSSRNGGY